MIRRTCLIFIFLAQVGFGQDASQADQSAHQALTVDRIYASAEFSSRGVSARWIDGHSGYLSVANTKAGNSIVSTDPASGKVTTLVAAEELVPEPGGKPLSIQGYTFSKNLARLLIYTNSRRVWRVNSRGDYWVLDRTSHRLKKLGGDAKPSTLMFAKFSPDGSQVGYVRERNIYIEHLDNDTIQKITKTSSPTVINGTFDWVYEEEFRLRDGFRWSPDGKLIAYWQIDTEGVHQFPLVNNTAGLYPEVQWFAYPKTGQQNPICQVKVYRFEDEHTATIPVRERIQDQRDHYIADIRWVETQLGLTLQLQEFNRLQNTNRILDVKGFSIGLDGNPVAHHNPLHNSTALGVGAIHIEKDAAWVDLHHEMLPAGKGQVTWVSERSGWRHAFLLTRPAQGVSKLTPITRGDFDVIQILHFDAKQRVLYFIASPENATQRYLFKCDSAGKSTRLTPNDQPGIHSYNISKDGQWAVHSWSNANSPPISELITLADHKTVRVLQDNKTLREKLKSVDRSPVEFLKVDIGDGIEVDAWCIKPPKLDPQKKYPVLVYVYGEPAGQTVLDRWGGSSYLWHAMLAQQGYVVMSFDNRGTPAPKGRHWRKCVYRKVGIMSPKDQAAALAQVLKDRSYLDADRVGIWGWSGGGSSTLQAMFKYPNLYHVGISIAPVPNQRYYDTIYQERYMGLPSDNFEGYRDGSAMNFAKNLQGKLLVIHGTGDDNCHYQTTEMLINELIKHNKQFSMMAYPNRSHSIREGRNTTRHLRHLMTNYLHQNLKRN